MNMNAILLQDWSLPSTIWAIVFIIISALSTSGLILMLLPTFRRYALAHPNARSSHRIATPQGGGFAVILVALGFYLFYFIAFYPELLSSSILSVIVASSGLLVLGGIDDVRPLPASFRFFLQCSLITLIIWHSSYDERLFPVTIPISIEKLIIVVALVWFINLVNFMDGIDLITTAQMLPVWGTILIFSSINHHLPLMVLSLCLIGSLIGFLPFNWPVARLFMGDIGSLPLGLLTGWALLQIAYQTSVLVALIPALYYLSDATITLITRLNNGEKIWIPHRSHFYQRACENGRSVISVVSMIATANISLLMITSCAMAMRIVYNPLLIDGTSLAVACLIVKFLLRSLEKKPSSNR